MVTYTYPRVLSVYGLGCSAAVAYTFFFVYQRLNLDINTIKFGHKPTDILANFTWYTSISVILFGIVAGLLALYELLLVIAPRRFKWYQYSLLRGIIYLALGSVVLGIAGDLGVILAPLTGFSGVIVILSAVLLYCECMDINEAKTVVIEQPNTSIKGVENL